MPERTGEKVYRKNHGSFQWVGTKDHPILKSPEIYWQGEEIAVMIDVENAVIHRHGDPAVVNAAHKKLVDSFNATGFGDLAKAIVVVTSCDWDVDELNKALQTSGYIMKVLEKMGVLDDVKKAITLPRS